MILLEQRQKSYERLVQTIKNDDGMVTKEITREIEELLDAEKESREKSRDRLKSANLGDSARRGQETAVENATGVIRLLVKCRRALGDGKTEMASRYMEEAAWFRYKAKQRKRQEASGTGGAWALYQQYLMESDSEFHSWLSDKGHEDVLAQVTS
ncbi:hypothetical protein FDJ44_gp56 [Microbacterium phage Pikmin]|uniref:Uncharacterized protein n=2 Tax=Pikminvirus pikmin TaxID=2560596 RepID=A0A2P1CIF6_9CAUD|nr:hypothetical protein FDJ44_gp56 [Microbacterium phage Pikmin]AVJ51047.1 hypothetical protein PBI_PAJAZA_56 [Microbacterium phage Pajaza]AVJ51194.1 hypothetical protein PBI_PIKMIN_56 [Microbacterium phage Pikmin]